MNDVRSVVESMMPLYYHQVAPEEQHVVVARQSWSLISEGISPALCDLRAQHHMELLSFTADEGEIIFKKEFATRFFEIYPQTRVMFSKSQQENATWAISIIDLCLNQLKDQKLFRKTLIELARSHIARGVCAVQYGDVGGIFFWALRRCLGSAYKLEAEVAWKILFSALLRVLVPVAVYFELNSDSGVSQRSIQISKAKMAATRNNILHSDIFSESMDDLLNDLTVEGTSIASVGRHDRASVTPEA